MPDVLYRKVGRRYHPAEDLTPCGRDEMYWLLVCAVRYSLGRRTSAVSDTCRSVRAHAHVLDVGQLGVLIRDIEEHGSGGLVPPPDWHTIEPYGADCDQRDWMALLAWLCAERARRSS